MGFGDKREEEALIDYELYLSEKSGAFCRTQEMHERVIETISELDDQDGEGHIWWNRFKELLEEYEPTLKINHLNEGLDDIPFL